MFDLTSIPLLANVGIFVVAAATVWAAGTRIARYASEISEKTGIGHAAMGLLLLGGVTSLPEAAVTVSASVGGNTALAVNNVLGGVAMQVAILVMADIAIGKRALTAVIPDAKVILQGGLNVVLLSVVCAGIIAGDTNFLGAGLWSWLLLAVYLYSLRLLTSSGEHAAWHAVGDIGTTNPELSSSAAGEMYEEDDGLNTILMHTALAAGAILIAGFFLSKTGEAIAVQTGIGSNFIGAVLVAISTSLPEVSTVLAAARLGLYTMAISDIFGTNLFDIALIWLVDVMSSGDAVLNTVGRFSVFAALLGILVTSLFLVGLAERRDRTYFRMGIDSIAVLVCYAGGIVILFALR